MAVKLSVSFKDKKTFTGSLLRVRYYKNGKTGETRKSYEIEPEDKKTDKK